MMRSRAICGALALATLVPSSSLAQSGRQNPFASLFGRAPERTGEQFTTLELRTTTGVQTGDTIEQDFHGINGEVPEGIAAGADAALSLEHVRDRFQARGQARYAYQEYRQTPSFGAPSYDVGGEVTAQPASRLSFNAGGHYVSSPFFHLVDPMPFAFGVPMPVDPFIAWLIDTSSVEATAGITSNYTKRSSISLTGQWRETEFPTSPGDNFSSRGFRAQWKRHMSRDLGVRAGYGRDEVRQRHLGDDHFMNELIDIGVDYSKALPIARRTSLAFSAETSVMRENGGNRNYRVNGGLDLQHGFQRTWRASIGVQRATEFLPGFAAPVFSDRVAAGISGYVSKRFIVYGNLNGGQGQIGFADEGKFLTYSGDARLTFAASRHFGIFGQYVYYHYQLPPNTESVVLLPKFARQAFSIGIQTWVPLVNKEQVNRDPR